MKAGWKTVKLCDVAEMRPPKSEAKLKGLKPTDEVGFLPMEDLTQFQKHAKALKTRTMSEVSNSYNYFANGDVLMAKISPCFQNGKMGIASGLPNGVGYGSSEYFVFRPSKELSAEWLFYYLQDPAFRRHATGKFSGNVGQQRLPKELIEELEIPLPPLAEQKRIVALLDEAFAGIDEAKAKAEDSLNRIQALFESHLQAIFTQRGRGWVERRLGELSRINYGYTESASAEMIGPHFLRITDIQDEGVDWSTVPYCRIDKDDLPKYKLSDGDIVFARTGATTGKSYLVSNPPDSVFASYLIRVQLSEKALLPGFLYLFFQTRSYWDVIRAGVSGSTQGGFNASKLGELTVPYPASLSDQNVFIRGASEIQADTLIAGKLAKKKLQALTELKASILAQAFAGEITA